MKKTDAFCDSSALVPLLVNQHPSSLARSLLKGYSIVVWWGAVVEITSALSRLHRKGVVAASGFDKAARRLGAARQTWTEVMPTERLRDIAQALLQRHPLRAADALQLAAALEWARQRPQGHTFICLDARLAAAARLEGFYLQPA